MAKRITKQFWKRWVPNFIVAAIYQFAESKIFGMNVIKLPDILAVQSELYGFVINTNFT